MHSSSDIENEYTFFSGIMQASVLYRYIAPCRALKCKADVPGDSSAYIYACYIYTSTSIVHGDNARRERKHAGLNINWPSRGVSTYVFRVGDARDFFFFIVHITRRGMKLPRILKKCATRRMGNEFFFYNIDGAKFICDEAGGRCASGSRSKLVGARREMIGKSILRSRRRMSYYMTFSIRLLRKTRGD